MGKMEETVRVEINSLVHTGANDVLKASALGSSMEGNELAEVSSPPVSG